MTISFSHIAALTKAAKTRKRLTISEADAQTIATLPGFCGICDPISGYIMHRPSPSAERAMVLVYRADGRYYLEVK